MRLLITGLTGFSGPFVARHMLGSGHHVFGVVRRDGVAADFLAHPNFTCITSNLDRLTQLPEGLDAIIHLAATSPKPGIGVEDFVRDNVMATDRLVTLARKHNVRKFLFFSSLSLYGRIVGGWANESTPILDPDAYGASKLLCEMRLREEADEMATMALRLPAVVGKGASRHWLAVTIAKAMQGQDIHIFNPEQTFNNAVHIADVSRFLVQMLERSLTGFQALTIASSGFVTIQEVVDTVLTTTRSKSKVIVTPAPRPAFLVSSELAMAEYGYQPRPVRDTLDIYLNETVNAADAGEKHE